MRRIVRIACLSAACAGDVASGATARTERLPSLATLLRNYERAANDPAATELNELTISGTIESGGLKGTFMTWRESGRERTDEHLSPRDERTLRLGDRFWYRDPDGNVRELTGSLARRARTEYLIDSGDFARRPDRCILRGRSVVHDRPAYIVDVAAEGGETETLYIDARTWLPARIAYDEDDGRATIDLSDWRSVAGHRFPYLSVESDGDHLFDTIRTTLAVDAPAAIDPATFAVPAGRTIEMSAPETVKLAYHDGHLYAPVSIAGQTFDFLIDTGAQSVLLDRRVAAKLGLAGAGAFEASGASRTAGLQFTVLPELRIGTRGKLSGLVATTLDLAASSGGVLHADGILGYPFFAAANVRLDIAGREMTFGPPGSVTTQGTPLPLDLDRGLAEVVLRLNADVAAPFVIDTGNSADLLLYKPFVNGHRGIVPFSSIRHDSYGIGGAASSYRTVLDRIDFGAISVYHVDTDAMLAGGGAFADRFDAGNIGLGVLKNFILTFDYAHAALTVERSAEFDDGRTRN